MSVDATGLVGIGPVPLVKSAIATVAAGANTSASPLVAAVTGKSIAVLGLTVSASAATLTGLVDFRDGTSTVKFHGYCFAAPINRDAPSGGYIFKGSSGTALNVYVGAGTGNAIVDVTYVEIDP